MAMGNELIGTIVRSLGGEWGAARLRRSVGRVVSRAAITSLLRGVVSRAAIASFLGGVVSFAAIASLLGVTACARTQPPATAPEVAPSPTSPPAAERYVEPVPSEVIPESRLAPGSPRLIEYPAVSLAERDGKHIELIEDLVIEERADDRRYDFDDAVSLVIDEAGRMYVHDSRRYRIVVYAPDGRFLRVYEGVGDMAPFHLGWIAQAGAKLAISTGNKVTVWSLAGEYLYDRSLLRRAFWRDVQGTVDGNLVGSFEYLDRDRALWLRIERISLEGDESLSYGAVPARRRDASYPLARADFAATRTGDVYLTRGDEYTVQAFAPDGAPRWVLHVDWPRGAAAEGGSAPPPALAAEPRNNRLDRLGRGLPLRVDGHGNLYIFPYVGTAGGDEIPVDVYSPAGERIFAGLTSERSWIRAKDDHVYGIEYDERAERQRVVRYRIEGLARGEGLR